MVLCTHVHSCFSRGLWHLFHSSVSLCVTGSSADTFTPSKLSIGSWSPHSFQTYWHLEELQCTVEGLTAELYHHLFFSSAFPSLFSFNMGRKMLILPAQHLPLCVPITFHSGISILSWASVHCQSTNASRHVLDEWGSVLLYHTRTPLNSTLNNGFLKMFPNSYKDLFFTLSFTYIQRLFARPCVVKCLIL